MRVTTAEIEAVHYISPCVTFYSVEGSIGEKSREKERERVALRAKSAQRSSDTLVDGRGRRERRERRASTGSRIKRLSTATQSSERYKRRKRITRICRLNK